MTSPDRPHLYLTVLGSCGTADSFRSEGWPSFVDEGLRIFDYIGRTGFESLVSEGLAEHEVERTDGEVDSDWGFQMARGEVHKTWAKRLVRGAKTNQVLVFDVVGDFIFRALEADDGRSFLSSWELEKYYRPQLELRSRYLWERDYDRYLAAATAFLGQLRDVRPDLHLGFHVAPACRNDGVRFKVDILNAHVDDYYRFCERLSRDLESRFEGLTTLQGPKDTWGADPAHPYGRYPFHYRLAYYRAFRREVKRWLGLPEETVVRPE